MTFCGFFSFNRLRKMNLEGNRLQSSCLSQISMLANLCELDLSENHLDEFPEDIGCRLQHVQRLKMADNRLTDVGGISKMSSLTFVDLSANWLGALPDLSHMKYAFRLFYLFLVLLALLIKNSVFFFVIYGTHN